MSYSREFNIGKRDHCFLVELSSYDYKDGEFSDYDVDIYALVGWDKKRNRAIWRLISKQSRRDIVLAHLNNSCPHWRETLTEE